MRRAKGVLVLRKRLRQVFVGKTERRLAFVILVTTMVPLGVALAIGSKMFEHASATWFNPDVGRELDRGVQMYGAYVKAVKDDLDHQTEALAADPVLREAARAGNVETIEAELDVMLPHFAGVLSLAVEGEDGARLAVREGLRVLDPANERARSVRRPLTADAEGPRLVATFAVAAKTDEELERTASVVKRYHDLEASRSQLYDSYLEAFATLLGITLILTVPLGILLARGVTRRISRLGAAINVVAQGDLDVRVPVTGNDELTDLARTFNRMLAEMAQSRARIEFLQRIGAWQDMAQRLAHEIKNPLTPIQLAVQEVHQKYGGEDRRFRALLDTTLEIVEEEVGTLRRLVGDFSNFARLPTAELHEADLGDFLHDCESQLGHLEDPTLGEGSADNEPLASQNVAIEWEVADASIPVAIDRQMLRRVVVNLVRNAVQAIRDGRAASGEGAAHGRVLVRAARDGDGARIDVEDDGPGIPKDIALRVFDPYFTTKADGTGLGLAIVKKVVVEHGGEIHAGRSERLGGAHFSLRLPGMKVLTVATAAREARERALLEGVETHA